MIDAIIHIAMAALVIGLVYWAYTQLITLVPVPAPVMTVLNVVVVVLLVLAAGSGADQLCDPAAARAARWRQPAPITLNGYYVGC